MYGSLQTALQALYGAQRPADATDKLLKEHGILLVAAATDRRESARQFGTTQAMMQDFMEVTRVLEAGGVPYVAIKGLPEVPVTRVVSRGSSTKRASSRR